MTKAQVVPCGLSYRRAMPARPMPSRRGATRLKRGRVRWRAGAAIAASRAGRRGAAVLAFLACLLVAGCAQRDRGSEDPNRSGGFYGGVFGGSGM